jgi:hypothetical protein
MRTLMKTYIKAIAFVIIFCFIGLFNACDDTTNAFSAYLEQYINAGSQGDTDLPDNIKAIVLICDNQTDLGGQNPPNYRFGLEEYNELPEDMRAETPEEVNTIIKITKMYDLVGYYTLEGDNSKTSDAYAIRAYVTVVNAETNIIWVKDQLFYNNPPEISIYGLDEFADVPMDAVVSFIQEGIGLPPFPVPT